MTEIYNSVTKTFYRTREGPNPALNTLQFCQRHSLQRNHKYVAWIPSQNLGGCWHILWQFKNHTNTFVTLTEIIKKRPKDTQKMCLLQNSLYLLKMYFAWRQPGITTDTVTGKTTNIWKGSCLHWWKERWQSPIEHSAQCFSVETLESRHFKQALK